MILCSDLKEFANSQQKFLQSVEHFFSQVRSEQVSEQTTNCQVPWFVQATMNFDDMIYWFDKLRNNL